MGDLGSSPALKVAEFHRACNLSMPDAPTALPERLALHRQDLIHEELRELDEAVEQGELDQIAWEMADLVYVVYGTALTYGIDLDAVLAEIHQANMSKLGPDGRPVYREDGKVLKGEHYRPPDIAAVLRRQAVRPSA